MGVLIKLLQNTNIGGVDRPAGAQLKVLPNIAVDLLRQGACDVIRADTRNESNLMAIIKSEVEIQKIKPKKIKKDGNNS